MSFAGLGLRPELVRTTQQLGFDRPTPIQEAAIPPLLAGRDALASAMTGSGKTAAFLLPILNALLSRPRGTTRALVVVPTRELAAQILDHLRGLAGSTGVRGAAIYGGMAMGPQEQAFRTGADVLIATPGRLLDHLQYRYARLTGIEWLVLDEADRMLEMGFLPDIRRILQQLPAERRTLLFSATLPAAIRELAMQMLRDPVRLTIGRASAPATGISHRAYPVPHDLKSHLLLSLLGEAPAKSVLAFTRTKHRANRLADFLEARGVACARIHGNRSQAQRTEAMAGFRRGRFRVLVATDIAARGIDVEALDLVVNFDVPHVPEDYVHRVGRTARASATGDACTFVAPEEEGDLRAIERHLGSALPRHRIAGFDYARRPAERLELPVAERLRSQRSRTSGGLRTSSGRKAAPASARPGARVGRTGAGMAWLRSVTADRRGGPHTEPRGRKGSA
jgi:ATP-dependent RNA helicase RhlE